MSANTVFFQSKPEFEVFNYTNRALDKHSISFPDIKAKKVAKAAISVLVIFLSIAIDLITVSFRVTRHLKILNDYNQSFNLRRPFSGLFKNYKKINYKLVKLDVRELECKTHPLTSRLIEKLEQIPKSSKIRKTIFNILAIVTAQLTAIIDTLIFPYRHYNHLNVVTQNKKLASRIGYIARTILISGIGLSLFRMFSLIETFNLPENLPESTEGAWYFLIGSALFCASFAFFAIYDNLETQKKLADSEANNLALSSFIAQIRTENFSVLRELNLLETEVIRLQEEASRAILPREMHVISEDANMCPVCYKDYSNIEDPITHISETTGDMCAIFCRTCMDTWLTGNHRSSCPNCRENITEDSLISPVDTAARQITVPRHFARP